jgi:hypothetical protein
VSLAAVATSAWPDRSGHDAFAASSLQLAPPSQLDHTSV